MAIQNTEFPAVVDYKDFDPGKVNPGEVVIVNILGMHAVYIGTNAGEATRMAAYEEAREYMEKTKEAAKRAEETRANAAVMYELMQRLEARVKNEVETAQLKMREELAKTEKVIKSANSIVTAAEDSAARAKDSAQKAEGALAGVNRAVDNLGETVRASLSAIALTSITGGKNDHP